MTRFDSWVGDGTHRRKPSILEITMKILNNVAMAKTTHGAFWTDLHIALNVVGHNPRRNACQWAPRYHRSRLPTGHAKFTILNKIQVFEL